MLINTMKHTLIIKLFVKRNNERFEGLGDLPGEREEIMAKFSDAKVFSKLDASPGFWQLKPDTGSS